MSRARAGAVLLAGLVPLAACAAAHNYLDPDAPRYAGARAVAAAAPAGPGLRVVTFNVKYAERVAEALAALRQPPLRDADVIALQEMDAPGVVALAQALGLNYLYYPSSKHPRTGRDFGNAILSPWPLEAGRKVLLPGRARGTGQARAAVAASVRVAGRPILVYSVHLTSPWGMGGGGRERQVDAVIADAGQASPVIVAGDFNTSGLGGRFRTSGFLRATRGVGRSVGPFSYDHIFVRGLRVAQPDGAGVARNGPTASDHWPVWAVLEEDVPVSEAAVSAPPAWIRWRSGTGTRRPRSSRRRAAPSRSRAPATEGRRRDRRGRDGRPGPSSRSTRSPRP
jgi:endonuclease/exonuclease/phosphatase family metal-dependent hydrolase